MTVATRRRFVVRACKQRGWNIQPAALHSMMEYVHDEDALDHILKGLEGSMNGGNIISSDIWEGFILAAQQQQEEAPKGRSKKRDDTATNWINDVQVVGAFETPKLIYETTRKQFNIKETQESLFGTPHDKTTMLAQRYALIHQRLLRHELFRPKQLGHEARTATTQHELTPIESLLGKTTASKSFLLLGILVQIEEGEYYLEDPTGQVPVSFHGATAVDDFFVTEHCILLVEGGFHDGMLYIHRLGHPLLESRDTSLSAMQQQLAHPFFAKSITQDLDQEPMFVVLSDVHLDQPRVLQQLESLFASYENYSPSRLPLFVLMGNFSSSCREAPPLDELAAVIAPFTNLARNAHFVLVPGPNDSPQQVLPLPPLSSKLPRVAHVHWATNPCRIYYKGREVALFNYNILHMLQRKQILWQEVKRTHDDDGKLDDQHQQMHHRLIKTLLDQAYLLPMQGVPVFWNYDHALRLYPLPDALILGGDALADGFHEIYGGCHVIHAGSMGQSGTYASYRLNDTMEVENASSDTKIQGSVVFEKFGCEHELLG